MKTWKIWLVTVPIILIMIFAAICVWLWNNVSTNWGPEKQAAQYVLNHTPIDHLQQYRVFTGSGLEDVFTGTDAFHHTWYAFYVPSNQRVYSVQASALVSEKQVTQSVKKMQVHIQQCNLGYVTDQASKTLKPDDGVVYEIRGKTAQGKTTFLYLDASNGHLLWKYVL